MNIYSIKRYLLITGAKLSSKITKIPLPPISSASAIIQRKNKILVINLSHKKGYALPGGLLQRNKTFEQALKHEILEETGLKIKSMKKIGTYACEVDFPTVNITYKINVKGKIISSAEGKPLWVSPDKAINKFCYLDNKLAVKQYF